MKVGSDALRHEVSNLGASFVEGVVDIEPDDCLIGTERRVW